MEQLKALQILKSAKVSDGRVVIFADECKVLEAIIELETLHSIKHCIACNNTTFEDVLLKEGTWMGTKPLPSEFFRKSEFDFGWDYYPRKDTLQRKCKNCGYISYSVPKDNQ